MPLTSKGTKILKAMEAQYGAKKGEEVFYASKNAGKISGVDSAGCAAKLDAITKIADACQAYDDGFTVRKLSHIERAIEAQKRGKRMPNEPAGGFKRSVPLRYSTPRKDASEDKQMKALREEADDLLEQINKTTDKQKKLQLEKSLRVVLAKWHSLGWRGRKGDALSTIAAACDSYERADDPIPTTPAIEKFIEKTNAEVGMHPNIK